MIHHVSEHIIFEIDLQACRFLLLIQLLIHSSDHPGTTVTGDEELLFQEEVRRIIKPDNQLQLTEAELNEEVGLILTDKDPSLPKDISKFNYKLGESTLDPPSKSEHMAIHLSTPGSLVHKSNGKAYEKIMSQQERKEKFVSDEENDTTTKKRKEIKNQFLYGERGVQTLIQKKTSTETQTEAPPVDDYKATISQASIYEEYVMAHYTNSASLLSENTTGGDSSTKGTINAPAILLLPSDDDIDEEVDVMEHKEMTDTLRVVERMVNHNCQSEIYQDYRYWGNDNRKTDTAANDKKEEGEPEKVEQPIMTSSKDNLLLPLWDFDFFNRNHSNRETFNNSKHHCDDGSFGPTSAGLRAAKHLNRMEITALCWNSKYTDLFAVGYGSYDFLHHQDDMHPNIKSGMVCCYSLKNTTFPEYMYNTTSAITCLDFYPNSNDSRFASLLAVGCFDGSVMVYNVFSESKKNKKKHGSPLFASSIRTGEHMDPVWQIRWAPLVVPLPSSVQQASQTQQEQPNQQPSTPQCSSGSFSKYPGFYSISTDGSIAKWNIIQSTLHMEIVMNLPFPINHQSNHLPQGIEDIFIAKQQNALQMHSRKHNSSPSSRDIQVFETSQEEKIDAFHPTMGTETRDDVLDGLGALSLAGGCCFDFHPTQTHLFVVGTEEGSIHLCSKSYNGQYLETYEGHPMRVNALMWNPFHERLFISCSADETIKIWDYDQGKVQGIRVPPTPLMVFELGCCVGDVAWSPHSSSVFAAVTNSGRIHMYDIFVNKLNPVLNQKLKRKVRLNHIRFNVSEFIVIVGDHHGEVKTLKLPPNLRVPVAFARDVGDLPETDKATHLLKLQQRRIDRLLLSQQQV